MGFAPRVIVALHHIDAALVLVAEVVGIGDQVPADSDMKIAGKFGFDCPQ